MRECVRVGLCVILRASDTITILLIKFCISILVIFYSKISISFILMYVQTRERASCSGFDHV